MAPGHGHTDLSVIRKTHMEITAWPLGLYFRDVEVEAGRCLVLLTGRPS